MLSSILLYLEDEVRAEPAIRLAVQLAKQARARIRGVTLVDTRHHLEACSHETAAFTTLANSAMLLSEQRQQVVRHRLSEACLHAGVDFDVRKYAGDPLTVLAREARFHDLVVSSGFVPADSPGLTSKDLCELIGRCSNPLLMLPPRQSTLSRVLLVYDGTESAGRAIRSYLASGPLAGADHRLLAVADNEKLAREFSREMGEYASTRCVDLEHGVAVGHVHQVLLPYVNKWQADLTVAGFPSDRPIYRRLFGGRPSSLLGHTSCAWWASN